jgi:hypothetical protein
MGRAAASWVRNRCVEAATRSLAVRKRLRFVRKLSTRYSHSSSSFAAFSPCSSNARSVARVAFRIISRRLAFSRTIRA